MRKVWASYGCMAITLLTAGVIFFSAPGLSADISQGAVAVAVAPVALGRVERLLALSGRVRYETEYAALVPGTGIVEEVYVSPGESVVAGQALFRMDSSLQEAAVAACLAQQEALPVAALPASLASAAQVLQSTVPSDRLPAAQQALEMQVVRAQVDGVVQQVLLSPHSGATAGTPAMTLSGKKQRIVATAALRDAEKLAVGQRARILSKGVSQSMATVASIGTAATDTATGQVVCEVLLSLDQGVNLPLGAQVDVEVELLRAEQVPTVPLQALDGQGKLWWVADGRAWHAEAEVLAQDEVSAWVSLAQGVQVVVDSTKELTPGQRVKEMSP